MTLRRRGALACVAALVAIGVLTVRPIAAQLGTAVVVHDLDGRAHSPLAPAAGQASVLFFINVECPVSNRYAPEIARIAADYHDRHVQAYLVYADAALTPSAARAHLAAFYAGTPLPAIIDTGWTLTTATGANVTPESMVYTSGGRIYRGRIDDWYVRLGQNRRDATRHDVRLALDAALAGRPSPVSETTAIGCYIDRREK